MLFYYCPDRQRELYKSYLDSPEIRQIFDGRLQLFVGLINLRKICNHPDLYDGGPYKELVTRNASEVYSNICITLEYKTFCLKMLLIF